ncbi:MAG: glucose-6-phosphate isomerase [Tannerellaceae bacterium]|jgi:glucose-6-phosphate isomerase|nr:glucose-6-phosphate isomerase [Tannerellaceae bacterium]
MKSISFNAAEIMQSMSEEEIAAWRKITEEALENLHLSKGKGSEWLGWLRLPTTTTEGDLDEIEHAAAVLREQCKVIVVVGIGGSYLGAKAVIDGINHHFDNLLNRNGNPLILYAGNNLSEDYLADLTEILQGISFGIISISKSGTTTEPAVSFRILKKMLEASIGVTQARERIITITDARNGALRTMTEREGYRSFAIPGNVGGRFSVFTPVGLLPIAAAGINIRELMSGAKSMALRLGKTVGFEDNIALQYAAVRNHLYRSGKKTEILANFEPRLHYIAEWWKQLYGESEGKDGKGIFPASVDLTTDLHSMGQWIQQGERSIFETVISIERPAKRVLIPKDKNDLDGMNFIAGKRISDVNRMAELGTRLAHVDGGVPVINISLPALTPYYIGQLLFFFEKACAISGYILDVNPFDQPGVEAYKNNMFALLNKPGYETEAEIIKKRLAQ